MRFDKYKHAFDIFHNTTAVVAVKEDYNDYTGAYTMKEIGTLTGDMQPYSGGLAEKEYGYKDECQKRMFCPSALIHDYVYGILLGTEITLGTEIALGKQPEKADIYITADRRTYQVVYAADYDMGLMLLLKEVDVNG